MWFSGENAKRAHCADSATYHITIIFSHFLLSECLNITSDKLINKLVDHILGSNEFNRSQATAYVSSVSFSLESKYISYTLNRIDYDDAYPYVLAEFLLPFCETAYIRPKGDGYKFDFYLL